MSEEAKVAYIQEKLREMKSKKRIGDMLLLLGACLIVVYIVLPFPVEWETAPLMTLVFAMIFVVIGSIERSYYRYKYNTLVTQLEKLS